MFKLSKTTKVIISSILIITSFILKEVLTPPADAHYHLVTTIFMLTSAFVAGYSIVLKAIKALRFRIVGIDALVTIAIIGAIIIGEYWEAAAVTFLFMFGDYLETKTIEKTRSSIKKLLDMAPIKATVLRLDKEEIIDAGDVLEGDKVIVKPGEKIAVDGFVLEGSAYVNQASITGESMPVVKELDGEVFAGTIVESGYLIVLARRVGDDTTFARILQLVEEAQDKKAKTQKFLERFSRYYTPFIIVLAVLFYLITLDIRLSLTLLVIACPGALVISAPVSIVAGIGSGAHHGVLVKGGEIMEKLGRIKVIAFDKTGTLTKGSPQVTKIKAYESTEEELIRIAGIGESFSEHPIAKAIIKKASEITLIDQSPTDVSILTGQGLKFNINGVNYLLGNRKLFESHDLTTSRFEEDIKAEEAIGQTVIIIGQTDKILGYIALTDTIRPEAPQMIKNLKRLGIKRIVMLTGDNYLVAKRIAQELQLDDFYAELLPAGKVSALKTLQETYGHVAMVGDGVNDAPALASADLGIAMGGGGTDVAIETADVVLMSDQLNRLSYAVKLSRATVRNMMQNIYFALIVAFVLLIGVLFEKVNLSFGMLIHELSVFLVIVNAIRLLGYKDRG